MQIDGIRRWLRYCGESFGCTQVHPYRWPDPSTKPEVPYMTFVIRRAETDPKYACRGGIVNEEVEEGLYDVKVTGAKQYQIELEVHLYNSPSGVADLAACDIGANRDQEIKNIFQANNLGYQGLSSIEDRTDYDDAEIHYHQVMVVRLNTVFQYEHVIKNHKVDDVTGIRDAIVVE